MDFSCVGVSGCASGSFLAAAVMALSSSTVGMRMVGRLEIFDIVLYLATIGAARRAEAGRVKPVFADESWEDYLYRQSHE